MTAQKLEELLSGERLTDRELQVLEGAAKGETARQTGERLFLAADTVREYRKLIEAKLGAKNITRAVVIGIGTGLVNIERVLEE